MRICVTDSLGRPVHFNGIDWFMSLILHSMYLTIDKVFGENLKGPLKILAEGKARQVILR